MGLWGGGQAEKSGPQGSQRKVNAKVCARMLSMTGWRRPFQVKVTLGNPVEMALLPASRGKSKRAW